VSAPKLVALSHLQKETELFPCWYFDQQTGESKFRWAGVLKLPESWFSKCFSSNPHYIKRPTTE
jgi:hypothetical protein